MSISSAENFIRNASEQVSQRDINDSLMKALAELTHELKRLDNDVHRVRREVQVSRRF
jgi:adenylosuccinate lyase